MYDFGIFGDFDADLRAFGFKSGVFFRNPDKSIVPGHFLKSDNRGEIKKLSKKEGFVLVDSGEYKTRRYVAEKGLADGIINAELYGKKSPVKYPDSGIDDKLMRFMAENNVCYVINIRNMIEHNRIREIMFNIKLAKKFKTPVMIVSGARQKNHLKHSSGLISAGTVLGFDRKRSKEALFYAQEKIIKRFKK